jgi:hypothetical protein
MHQITVIFTGQSKIVGVFGMNLLHVTCLAPGVPGDACIFGKFVDLWLNVCYVSFYCPSST